MTFSPSREFLLWASNRRLEVLVRLGKTLLGLLSKFPIVLDLVEHPEKGVPGAWYEDTCYDYDSFLTEWPFGLRL